MQLTEPNTRRRIKQCLIELQNKEEITQDLPTVLQCVPMEDSLPKLRIKVFVPMVAGRT